LEREISYATSQKRKRERREQPSSLSGDADIARINRAEARLPSVWSRYFFESTRRFFSYRILARSNIKRAAVRVKLKSRLSKIRLKLIEKGLPRYGLSFHLLSKLGEGFYDRLQLDEIVNASAFYSIPN